MQNGYESKKATFEKPYWYKDLSKFTKANNLKAFWQILNTVLPYIALWAIAIYLVENEYNYLLLLPVIFLASGFLIRIFIMFHDCCHGSFFTSNTANRIFGYISGIMTLTPFEEWRRSHGLHHVSAGDLDRRGIGDVWTMTVDEYCNSSRFKKLYYRLYRNPFIMFGLGPAIIFILSERFSQKGSKKIQRRSVFITNVALLIITLVFSFTIGLWDYLIIQIPLTLTSGSLGVWLFYVQHQYEEVYWARKHEWDPVKAALEGSSYYKLPKILQWFTGNIGLHHIHHLKPNIPNYYLQQCYDEIQGLQEVEPLTIKTSLKSLWLKLWHEKEQRMVSFRYLKKLRNAENLT